MHTLPVARGLQVSDAIAAYLRAADTSKYNEVIAKANEVRRDCCLPAGKVTFL